MDSKYNLIITVHTNNNMEWTESSECHIYIKYSVCAFPVSVAMVELFF